MDLSMEGEELSVCCRMNTQALGFLQLANT